MPDTDIRPKPPSRATVSATLTFGMVAVPIKLYTATEDVALVERHQYTEDGHQVGTRSYDKETGLDVTSDAIVKRVTVGDKQIDLTDEEIEQVTAGYSVDRSGVEIVCLVPLDALAARYVTTKLYQVRPGDGKTAATAFSLLMSVLTSEKVGALIRIPIKSAPRYGVVTGDGTLRMLHFDSEVRQERPMPEPVHSERDLEMARALIMSAGVDTPELIDPAGEALRQYLDMKAAGEAPTLTAAPAAPAATADLSAALEASLAALKIAA